MKSVAKVIVNPEICHGKPVINGTRVMVWQILELLELGQTAKEIYEEFPTLPQGSIEVALHYAADRAKFERYVSFDTKTANQVFT